MAHDETEFDKLLREAREWEARDRNRQKSFGMKEDPDAPSYSTPSSAPTATVDGMASGQPRPLLGEKAKLAAPAIRAAFKAAAKDTQAQRAARRAKGSAWGWIWAILILFFIIRHFSR